MPFRTTLFIVYNEVEQKCFNIYYQRIICIFVKCDLNADSCFSHPLPHKCRQESIFKTHKLNAFVY